MKQNEKVKLPSLHEVKEQVLEEGREWTRQRLQHRRQRLAGPTGELSPLRQRQALL